MASECRKVPLTRSLMEHFTKRAVEGINLLMYGLGLFRYRMASNSKDVLATCLLYERLLLRFIVVELRIIKKKMLERYP